MLTTNDILKSQSRLEQLTREAKILGATASAYILTKDILVRDDLAGLCNGEYTCPEYGLAASCPPYVKGPAQFRKWQIQSRYSIVVKIELPASIMFSNERRGVMQLLHQMVATIEQKALATGFDKAKAFAGGSCKSLFCEKQKECCVITANKPCRHKEFARPSMSGFGIDVTQLMISSGWSAKKTNLSDSGTMGWVAGLIMLV
jgi:predicted metal-binding protein